MTTAIAVSLYAADLSAAKELYFRGVDGDRQASRQSMRLFEKLAAERPNDAIVLAYLASNKLLESGRTLAIWNKNRLAKEGITGLDRAVQMAPDNLEVRFVRAVSTYDLPSFFKRQQQSEADFEWLRPRVEEAARKRELEPRLAAASLYYYGIIEEKKGNNDSARRAWEIAARAAPGERAGKNAAAKLRGQ